MMQQLTAVVLLAALTLLAVPGCADDYADEGTGASHPDVALPAYLPAHARVVVTDTLNLALRFLDSLFAGHAAYAFRPTPPDPVRAEQWADSVLAALTPAEKIGQLFIVELPEQGLRTLLFDPALQAVQRYGVGGFLVRRLLEPEDVYDATQRLQREARVPLFFAADYERGAGRISNAFTELPSNMALGAARDTVFASIAGRLTAIESRAIGVNLLFAPVVDVNNNPDNPIINVRSYGEDPGLVARLATAFVHEAQAHGVLTTLKHFPGHGNTSVDTHTSMGVIDGDREALHRVELRPYYQTLQGPAPPAGVMSAHLWAPAVDARPLPATFSRYVLHDLLRGSLGFKGFVITDDVKMGALNQDYSFAERIVRPLEAGADIILTPDDLGDAIQAVQDALGQGRLTEADIDGSVRRILVAKASLGLHEDRYADRDRLDFLLAAPHGDGIAQALADQAVTLLKSNPALPLRPAQRLALIQLTNYRDSESIAAAMDTLAASLGQPAGRAALTADLRLDRDPTSDDTARILQAADSADVAVLALYLRLTTGRGEAGLFEGQERLVRQMLAAGTPVVLVTLGNPYAVTTFSDADAFVVAYDQTVQSIHTTARILYGLQRPRGLLPVTVAPYPFGSGLDGLE